MGSNQMRYESFLDKKPQTMHHAMIHICTTLVARDTGASAGHELLINKILYLVQHKELSLTKARM